MRRRLYWVLPSLDCARRTAADLREAGVEARHTHYLARPGIDLGSLPPASLWQKTDVAPAAGRGMFLGSVLGALVAVMLALFPANEWGLKPGGVLLSVGCGMVFGMTAMSLSGRSVPNSRLARFAQDLEHGNILLMVDVPRRRLAEIQELLDRRHPEAAWRGAEPTLQVFP